MRNENLILATAAFVLCTWGTAQAKDADGTRSRCVGIAQSSSCAAGIVNLQAVITVERPKAAVKAETKAPAQARQPQRQADPEREIWRHHGVG